MIYRVITACVFIIVLGLVIGYARGYRLDVNNTELTSRGLVAVTSSPRSAKIYVNTVFMGVTDTSLYLEPNTYTVNIVKEGYFPWSKTIKIQGEIVQSVDATLYPINASLNPLTNIGVVRALPFGIEGKKVLIFTTIKKNEPTDSPQMPMPNDQVSESKEGIFVYDPRTQAVSLFPSLTHIVDYGVLGTEIDPNKYDVLFSPDFDQAILLYNPKYLDKSHVFSSQFDPSYPSISSFDSAFLINLGELNTSPLDVTGSALSLIEAWSAKKGANLIALLGGYHRQVQDFITSSAKIIDISPDKTRILYEATVAATLKTVLEQPLIGANQTQDTRSTQPGSLYVYDVREDKNYLILLPAELARQHAYPLFHPNSKNIILDETNSIGIMDYDGINRQKLYSGPYDPSFFVVTSDGRILVLTNFNSGITKSYDLYAIGIR